VIAMMKRWNPDPTKRMLLEVCTLLADFFRVLIP
jgi:hypothetical protein